MTDYVGELVQHDTSIHLWAPLAEQKWYLITSIDDHSRLLMYAELWERESSWAHIVAAKSVITRFGCPLNYYVDNHAIFRFIERRDTVWTKSTMTEELATVQWKSVLTDLDVNVIYALSPAAKGKVERPYRWLQDHLVRICVREGINKIEQAREVLYDEVRQYNERRVHSTTKEVPRIRFENSCREHRSVFRSFEIQAPFKTVDDIFCVRWKRIVNPYRKISINKFMFPIQGAPIGAEIEIRVSFELKTRMALLRFWHGNLLIGEHRAKIDDLKKVQL